VFYNTTTITSGAVAQHCYNGVVTFLLENVEYDLCKIKYY